MLTRKWQKLKRSVRRAVSAWHDRPLAAPTGEEQRMIGELRVRIAGVTIPDIADADPSEKEWAANRRQLKRLVEIADPRGFLRWEVIRRTMCVDCAAYLGPELSLLMKSDAWETRWRQALVEVATGHPLPHWRYPRTSGNPIHHAYHLARCEEAPGTLPESSDIVLEFGGGYGSMCRVLHNLGFKGRYIIFDLPEFSALQRYFLESIGIRAGGAELFDSTDVGAVCISDMAELARLLMRYPDGRRLFVATWSISETPQSFRQQVLPLVADFSAFLIAYQAKFNEVDNVAFFEGWRSGVPGVSWWDWKIEHIDRHNRYLMGRTRGAPGAVVR